MYKIYSKTNYPGSVAFLRHSTRKRDEMIFFYNTPTAHDCLARYASIACPSVRHTVGCGLVETVQVRIMQFSPYSSQDKFHPKIATA